MREFASPPALLRGACLLVCALGCWRLLVQTRQVLAGGPISLSMALLLAGALLGSLLALALAWSGWKRTARMIERARLAAAAAGHPAHGSLLVRGLSRTRRRWRRVAIGIPIAALGLSPLLLGLRPFALPAPTLLALLAAGGAATFSLLAVALWLGACQRRHGALALRLLEGAEAPPDAVRAVHSALLATRGGPPLVPAALLACLALLALAGLPAFEAQPFEAPAFLGRTAR